MVIASPVNYNIINENSYTISKKDLVSEAIAGIESMVENSDCSQKSLFLPWHLYMGFNFTGRIVSNPAGSFFSCPIMFSNNPEFGGIKAVGSDDHTVVGEWVETNGEVADIKNINLKYIILTKDVDWENYGWLDELEYLETVKDLDSIKLYEFKD